MVPMVIVRRILARDILCLVRVLDGDSKEFQKKLVYDNLLNTLHRVLEGNHGVNFTDNVFSKKERALLPDSKFLKLRSLDNTSLGNVVEIILLSLLKHEVDLGTLTSFAEELSEDGALNLYENCSIIGLDSEADDEDESEIEKEEGGDSPSNYEDESETEEEEEEEETEEEETEDEGEQEEKEEEEEAEVVHQPSAKVIEKVEAFLNKDAISKHKKKKRKKKKKKNQIMKRGDSDDLPF